MPVAPGRFSITTGWPRFSPSRGAMMRATTSVPPPGGKPTTMRTGFAGYWASASPGASAIAAAIAGKTFVIVPPSRCNRSGAL